MADIDVNWTTVEQNMVQIVTTAVGASVKKVFNAKTQTLAETIAGRGPFPAIGIVHASFDSEGQPQELRIPLKGISRFLVLMWIPSGKGPVDAIEAGGIQAAVRRALVNEVGTPTGMMIGRFYLESETTESVDGATIKLASMFALPISMSV